MKLSEFETWVSGDSAKTAELFIRSIDSVSADRVRVEIHSLDDPPWPTEMPGGWGVGWWCRFMSLQGFGRKVELEGIVYSSYVCSAGVAYQIVLPVPVEGSQLRNIGAEAITAFGPRAEVGG